MAIVSVSVAPESSAQPYPVAHWQELATGMIWCYQEKEHKAEKYQIGWKTYITTDFKTWSVQQQPEMGLSRTRAEYVRDIQIAAARRDAAMAEEIYRMCQRHSTGGAGKGDSLKYANGATPAMWIDAVVHAAACYDPDHPTNSKRVRSAGQVFRSPFGEIKCVN